jgi:hypothetical protein
MMGESDTQKSKPPGPIIMMGGDSDTQKSSHIIFIIIFSAGAHYAEPKPIS